MLKLKITSLIASGNRQYFVTYIYGQLKIIYFLLTKNYKNVYFKILLSRITWKLQPCLKFTKFTLIILFYFFFLF